MAQAGNLGIVASFLSLNPRRRDFYRQEKDSDYLDLIGLVWRETATQEFFEHDVRSLVLDDYLVAFQRSMVKGDHRLALCFTVASLAFGYKGQDQLKNVLPLFAKDSIKPDTILEQLKELAFLEDIKQEDKKFTSSRCLNGVAHVLFKKGIINNEPIPWSRSTRTPCGPGAVLPRNTID